VCPTSYLKLFKAGPVGWYMPIIPSHRKQKQEDLKFEISLGHTVRPYLKKGKAHILQGSCRNH
jgi:hypothetical protein